MRFLILAAAAAAFICSAANAANSTDPHVTKPKDSTLEAVFMNPASGSTDVAASNTVTVTPGVTFIINCTIAGTVKVGFPDGSTLTITVAVGTLILPWAVNQVFVTGTSATATYANLSQ
jgi:ethanolamine utilization microcompartment shell protein EutS